MIPKLIQKTNQNKEVKYCQEHDRRALFHTEPTEQANELKYLKKFISYVADIIDKNKQDVFKHIVSLLPIETVDFTEGVFNELKKVFNGQDRNKKHHFNNPELEQDFEMYLKQIHNNEFWEHKGFSTMKSAINSILIVDLAAEPNEVDSLPEPYYYFLPIDRLIDMPMTKKGKVEYIIFKDKKDEEIYYVFDDMFYRTYRKGNGTMNLIVENMHGLGYVPARSFWSTPFNHHRKIQKKSPISQALSKLDWLLIFYVFEKHASLYAGFPIDVMYEQKCNYHDDEGNECENGYITKTVNSHGIGSPLNELQQTIEPCPACNGNKPILGAGTVITAPAMTDKDDPDLIQGLNRISADVESLEFLKGKIKNQEQSIAWDMIGYTQEDHKEAMNETQIIGNYESRQNVILEVKSNFEKAESFAVNTVGLLRYGNTAYLGSTINYGERFFLQTLNGLKEGIEKSKTSGLPNFEIAAQQKQLMLTKYQANPQMVQRSLILTEVEPYQGYTLKEITEINNTITLDPIKLLIKFNFQEYILRFEREFTNVANFMPFDEFNSKIDFINAKLIDYANADQQTSTQPNSQGDEGFAT